MLYQKIWKYAKRVLRYLKATLKWCLVCKPTGDGIIGFVDTDWAGGEFDRKSYTGYIFNLSEQLVQGKARSNPQ